MADCSGLENRHRSDPIQGSNPCPSAQVDGMVETLTFGDLSINDEATRGESGWLGEGSGGLAGGREGDGRSDTLA